MSWMQGRWMWLALIASLAFNAGVGTTLGVRAYDRRCGRFCESDRCPKHRGFLERLDLRPDQLPEMEAEGEALHTEMEKLRQATASENAILADLLVAAEPDAQAIGLQLDKLASLHRQKQQLVVDHFLRLGALLDDSQRQVFEQTIWGTFSRCGAAHPGMGPHNRPHGRHGPRVDGPCQGHSD